MIRPVAWLERGAILVQVLVMAALMLILATAVIKMSLHRVTLSARTIQGSGAMKQADIVVQSVYSAWALNGQMVGHGRCTGYTWDATNSKVCCSGLCNGTAPPGTCGCACVVTYFWNGAVRTDTATTADSGGFCRVTANIPYGIP